MVEECSTEYDKSPNEGWWQSDYEYGRGWMECFCMWDGMGVEWASWLIDHKPWEC